MPFTTTNQIVYDGYKAVTVHFTGICDGSGDENLEKKVDISALVYLPKLLKIMNMEYEVNGGIVRLFWDAPDPVEFQALATVGSFDYASEGGRNVPADRKADLVPPGSGGILLSTVGFDIGSSYSIKLDLKKKY